MAVDSVWNTALAVIGSLGGGGAIVLALSGWIGKIWANRIMKNDLHRHNQDIEALKTKLTNETESYKTRLKKSEFVFEKEFSAANELASFISELETGYSDPFMDDSELFFDHLEISRDEIAKKLGGFLSRHSAILTAEVRKSISLARELCVLGLADEVPGGVDGREASEGCYKLLKESEDQLIRLIRDQSSHTREDPVGVSE